MLWKLAVSTIMLPAYLGISAVSAHAAATPQSTPEPEVAHSTLEVAPEYYANNYNYQSNCKRGYGYRSSGYRQQNYYRPHHNGYHQTNYYKPQHNRYKSYGHGYRNNGYHNNGYQNNGYQNNGYHNNGYHNNGYHH
jgi:hypothetical protein